MITHIDLSIMVDSFLKFREGKLESAIDFWRFIKGDDTDIVIYGYDGEKCDDYKNNIVSNLLQGAGERDWRTSDEAFKDFSPDIVEYPFQAFFLNTISDGINRKLIDNGFFVGNADNYEQVFLQLSYCSSIRIEKETSRNRFNGWDSLLPDYPVTDIIISDPYAFDDQDGNYPLDNNIYRLLSTIRGKYSNLKRVIIFTSPMDSEQRKDLYTKSKSILGNTYMYFIKFCRDKTEHDRHIFFNYHHISMGSSMNLLYDKNGNFSPLKSSTMRVLPLCKKENRDAAEPVLVLLNEVLENLKKESKLPQFIKSNLLAKKNCGHD